jgi:hypothetical protein
MRQSTGSANEKKLSAVNVVGGDTLACAALNGANWLPALLLRGLFQNWLAEFCRAVSRFHAKRKSID